MNNAVFLDLNGTLVTPIKVNHPSELLEIPGAAQAIRRLSLAGCVCPVVTIQSRIEKGLFSEQEFKWWFKHFQASFLERGAHIVGPYICPHRFSTNCECKKPNQLLYVEAAQAYAINLGESYVIGDTAADMEAASRFGGKGVFVRTGYGESEEEMAKALPYCSYVGRDLGECVDWILANKT